MPASSPTRTFAIRALLTGLAFLLWAIPALSYRIYLRDGTALATTGKYTVEGDFALATLENGTETRIRLEEIDVEKTERLNRRAYTSAVVIEGGEERLLALDDPAMRQRTLAEYVRERREERDERNEADLENRSRRLRRTTAGYVDLRALEREPAQGPTAAAIDEALKRHGLGGARVFQGTASDRYLVEVVADNEPSVFSALGNLAAAILDLADASVEFGALEVYIANGGGSRAGMFTLSEESAALLASEQIDPGQFFLQFVEF